MLSSLEMEAVINFPTYGYPPIPFDVENLDRYCPGGLNPIILGDVLGDRYQVMRKLGHGGYATVWLCYDMTTDTWKAIKVLSAFASDEKSSSEIKILKHFEGVSDEKLEKNHVCLSREHFYVDSPNGRHLCIVMPIFGHTLQEMLEMDYGNMYNMDDLERSVCIQLIKAMKFLHDKGVCHGDFRPRNILFKMKGLDKLSVDEMMELLGPTGLLVVPPPPTRNGAGPDPHLPEKIYPSLAFELPTHMISEDIMVTDFGEAYHISDPPISTGIPLSHASPEVLLENKPLGFGADIWALGNTICDIRIGSRPLSEFDTREYVETLESMLGPLPEPHRSGWIKKGYETEGLPPASELPLDHPVTMTLEDFEEYHQQWLDEGYGSCLERLIKEDHGYGTALEPGETLGPNERDVGNGCKWVTRTLATAEADQLLDIMTEVFKYDPAERLSAAETLAHPWCQDWIRRCGRNVSVEKVAIDVVKEEVAAEQTSVDGVVQGQKMVVGNTKHQVVVVDVVMPQDNGILASLAWIARGLFPRLYQNLTQLGGLCIYDHF